jgi:misacylated tRNA(Ala) deacylase
MNKEYDPRMHSAEHILNQTMVRMFNKGRSFSAHIEKKKSKCDYHFDRALTQDELAQIENKVNEIINQNLPVTESYLTREKARKNFSLDKLPDQAGDNIRLIKVGDYDSCPCIGKHVVSTKEIVGFKMISSSFEDGVLRLRFRLKD